MDKLFFNPRAATAKRRQAAHSPSRIIQANMIGSAKDWGRDCKWCGTWEANWPANQMYICDKCKD